MCGGRRGNIEFDVNNIIQFVCLSAMSSLHREIKPLTLQLIIMFDIICLIMSVGGFFLPVIPAHSKTVMKVVNNMVIHHIAFMFIIEYNIFHVFGTLSASVFMA